MSQELSHEDRLAICKLTKKRFPGRKELIDRAKYDSLALVELEFRLGLRSKISYEEEKYKILYVYPQEKCRKAWERLKEAMKAFGFNTLNKGPGQLPSYGSLWWCLNYDGQLTSAFRAFERARENLRKIQGRDQHAMLAPETGRFLKEFLCRKVIEASEEAGIRTAKHSHSTEVIFTDGKPWAKSETEKVSSRSVGLPRAYYNNYWYVSSSSHIWYLNRDFVPYADGKYVYISPTRRVRSGRGTSLVTESLISSRGRSTWKVV